MEGKDTVAENASYTSILKYQINAPEYKFQFDAYCEPLYWYTRMYCKHSSHKKMKDIADELHITSGLLTKKLNVKNKQHRELTITDIEALCSIMQTSLLSIIQMYENRTFFEKNPNLFSQMATLSFSDIQNMLMVEKTPRLIPTNNQPEDIPETIASESEQPIPLDISSWAKKWYFYFPSSDSAIIEHRKKTILKEDTANDITDSEVKELYDLYSDDHIYSGIITISPCYDGDTITYRAKLKYLTNPPKKTIAEYEGIASLSVNEQAIFITLNNIDNDNNDMIYIIIDALNVEPDFQYAMASVLTLSKNKNKSHRRPCSLRMILSQDVIPVGTKMYNIMCSNLMMNDSIIRIDEHGYNELKKFKSHYASPALDLFLEKYPDIAAMEAGNFINVHKCAYITESLIYNLKDTDTNETLYLEALLRLHSLASWYSKAKAVKANKLLSAFSSENS